MMGECHDWGAVKLFCSYQCCRSRESFGCAKDFSRISPNLPEKNSTENDLQKNTTAFLFMLGAFFKSKHTSSTSFAQIFRKELNENKHDVCAFIFGAIL